MYSSIIFGLLPAARTTAGDGISVGIKASFFGVY
jgi:hypothetical protein